MAELKVGAGIASLDVPIEKYPAQSQFAVCEDKYDECNVRAIAIEAGEKKIMLMAYDLSDLPEVPDLEKKIADAVGYDEDDIVMTVTHNHTSPCDRGSRSASEEEREAFREMFFRIELEASIKAAKAAVESARPAKYGYGEINSDINANEVTGASSLGLYCDEDGNGFTDRTLAILKFVDENGKLIAVMMNYCCHATFAMGKDANGKFATSGNFPGIASRFVEDYYGNGAVAAWTSGAAGNQNPILTHFVLHYTDGYQQNLQLPDGVSHLLMQYAGRKHGVDAINGIERITDYKDEMEINHVKGSVKIENQKSMDNGMRRGKPVDYGLGVRSNQPEPAPAPSIPVCVDDPEHPTTLLMELLTLGDVAIVGLGCELFSQIGRDIKNALPAKHTIVVTHTPGYVGGNPHAVGYIVDKSTAKLNFYKNYRNLKPGAYDELIVDAAKDLYDSIK